jgi:RNA polymerase sigma-70 factor (ECF subfamily)
MPNNPEDYELIKSFLNGDEKAFNLLATRYQSRIYWHARRMVGNHLDADEIVQEVFIVMYNKLSSFNFQSSLFTWIYRITSTRSLNLIKKNKLKKLFFIDADSVDKRADDDIIINYEQKEKFRKMEKYLQLLPEKQREVFIFRNFDGLTYEEISAITGKSEGALKANYFHAFNKIKELMNKNEH